MTPKPVGYYVCDSCGHFWRQPSAPSECHRCGHEAIWTFISPTMAREHAETIKTIRR